MFSEISDQRNQSTSTMRNILLTRLNTNINMHSIRRCVFCERYGHLVNDCNDQGMTVIESELITKKRSIINDHNIPLTEKRGELCEDIRYKANSSEIIKTRMNFYAVRHCGASFIDDYLTWTMKICNKVYDMTSEEEDSVLYSVLASDYIPFDNDPVNYLIDADNLIRHENNDDSNNIRQQNPTNRYTSTSLQILSYLAEMRLEELIHARINEEETFDENEIQSILVPNTPIHKPQYIECYVNTNYTDTNNNEECPICYETKESKEFVMTNCSHTFCCLCIKKSVNVCENELKCALCRSKIELLTFNDKENCEKF